MTVSWRWRLLLVLFLVAFALRSVTTIDATSTLVAVVFDAATWSIPAPIHAAVHELRAEGYEIRMVDVDVTNGDDGQVAELRGCLEAAKTHGLPAVAFQSGSRIAVAPVPATKEEFKQAVQ